MTSAGRRKSRATRASGSSCSPGGTSRGSIGKHHRLSYAGRTYSASPAAGYLNVHLAEQRELVNTALALDAAGAERRLSA